jgi:molybdate transport system substrate-binding protein
VRIGAVALAAALVAGCGGGRASGGQLTVGVASSLVEVIDAVAAEHRDAEFQFSVAGSQILVAQVREGAPLDVVITADARTVQNLEALGLLAGPPARFAGNRLAMAVRPGNPLGISALEDLADPDLILVLASPEVPAGAYAEQLFTTAGIDVVPDSLEPSVRAVLAKVELGEADAGIVYVTDLAAAAVEGVEIDPAHNVLTAYYAGVVAGSDKENSAAAFVDFLQSDGVGAILARYGFLP